MQCPMPDKHHVAHSKAVHKQGMMHDESTSEPQQCYVCYVIAMPCVYAVTKAIVLHLQASILLAGAHAVCSYSHAL